MSEIKNIEYATAESVEASSKIDGLPEIVNINYDLWQLLITLDFPEKSGIEGPIYIRSTDVIGFRVLDEGNLLEFWGAQNRPDGWMWKVKSGGWIDLESTRKGFVSGYGKLDVSEYLISGINDCVSIITATEPVIVNPPVP